MHFMLGDFGICHEGTLRGCTQLKLSVNFSFSFTWVWRVCAFQTLLIDWRRVLKDKRSLKQWGKLVSKLIRTLWMFNTGKHLLVGIETVLYVYFFKVSVKYFCMGKPVMAVIFSLDGYWAMQILDRRGKYLEPWQRLDKINTEWPKNWICIFLNYIKFIHHIPLVFGVQPIPRNNVFLHLVSSRLKISYERFFMALLILLFCCFNLKKTIQPNSRNYSWLSLQRLWSPIQWSCLKKKSAWRLAQKIKRRFFS